MFFGSPDEHFLLEHPQIAGHVRIGVVLSCYGLHYAENGFTLINGEVSLRGEYEVVAVKPLKDKLRVQVILDLVNVFSGIGEAVFAFIEGLHVEVALGGRNGVKDLLPFCPMRKILKSMNVSLICPAPSTIAADAVAFALTPSAAASSKL